MTNYIICTTPRSGSTLLCDLLDATDVAGHPKTFYKYNQRAGYAAEMKIGFGDEQGYLLAVKKAGRSENGSFGMCLTGVTRPELLNILAGLFPDTESDLELLNLAFDMPKFVFLHREDVIAQAVSRLQAEQSGVWSIEADGSLRDQQEGTGELVYDRAAISDLADGLESQNREWLEWFAEFGIKPVTVAFEALEQNPEAALVEVLEALGLDATAAHSVEPRTVALENETTEAWIERYSTGN